MVSLTDNRAAVQFGRGLVSKIGLYVLAWVSKKADLIAYSISEVEARIYFTQFDADNNGYLDRDEVAATATLVFFSFSTK